MTTFVIIYVVSAIVSLVMNIQVCYRIGIVRVEDVIGITILILLPLINTCFVLYIAYNNFAHLGRTVIWKK